MVSIEAITFSSGFNGDLFDGNIFNHPTYEDGESRIRSLSNMIGYVRSKETFPNEILKESEMILRTVISHGG